MTQYKVIAAACPCVLQKRVLKYGDVVSADFFLEGQAERLIKEGFITELPTAKEQLNPNSKKK